MKFTIFGGTGMLGHDLLKALGKSHEVVSFGSKDMDITDLDAVYAQIKINRPDVVINTAALTDVDKCELEPDLAFRVNAMGPKNIAIACGDHNVKMVHISTDYVFDGTKGEPYTEFDRVNPINNYGRSKAAGEDFVRTLARKHAIIRTAWVFGEKRSHFVDYVANSLMSGDEITAVQDMISSPTYAHDLAEAVIKIAMSNEAGTFHAANKGYCSRVQMVEEIMKIMRKTSKLVVVNQSQWKRPAKRPVFSALKNYHMGLVNIDEMAGWRDALKRYIRTKFYKAVEE